jgi:uncharacterized Zn finger protein (UPF0148 family)
MKMLEPVICSKCKAELYGGSQSGFLFCPVCLDKPFKPTVEPKHITSAKRERK